MKEHLIKEHQVEVDHGHEEVEEEMKTTRTTPLPRKRGRPRGSFKKRKMRGNNLGQELQREKAEENY